MAHRISEMLQEQEGEGWFARTFVAHAPLIVAIFANFVVVISDVRAYDVVYRLTTSWWKALAASLACAIPFIIWEIAWQYNHTTDSWRKTSLGMAGLAFGMSIFLGVADFLYTSVEWANLILVSVVIATGIHTVVGFLYFYNDPDVARRRRKAQSLAKMLDHETNANVAEQLLESGRGLLGVIEALKQQYDPEDVERVMAILAGRKVEAPPKKAQGRIRPPVAVMANETDAPGELRPTNPIRPAPKRENGSN